MSARKKDYYKILGVTKDAEPEHIKRAYKRLAIKWHPDKNPGREKEAEEKFKDIAEAYAVLSNERKRRQYDKYGTVDFATDREPTSRGRFGFDDFNVFGGDGFQGFTFERAENLFRDVFGEEFEQYGFGRNRSSPNINDHPSYNNRQDFANDFMGGRGFGNFFNDFGFGSFGGVQDPFANDFFRNLGGMGGFNFGTMGGLSGGYGGTSQSVSTSTIIRNGKEVTVTKTTITNPDGTTHTEVQEHVKDGGRTLASNRYVDQGQVPRLENSNKQIAYEGNSNEVKTQK